MTQVIFYILAEQPAETDKEPQHFVAACHFINQYYQQGKKSLVYTNNQQQAELIDELLWQMNEHFVPHNLVGEGPDYGAPVEIFWQQPNKRRPVLINLNNKAPEFAGQFTTLIDFVPNKQSQKELARERYRQYRQRGFELITEQL